MAIFNSILFHRARKSVGNVTLYTLKEQNVARAKGIHRRDRKSLAQFNLNFLSSFFDLICFNSKLKNDPFFIFLFCLHFGLFFLL